MKRYLLLLIILLSFALYGCSSQPSSLKPKEVRDDIWEISEQTFYKVVDDFYNIDDFVKSIDNLDSLYEYDTFNRIYDNYMNSNEQVSKEEYSILNGVNTLIESFILRNEASISFDREKSVKYRDKFYETEEVLREYFPELIEYDQELIDKAQLLIDEGYLCLEAIEDCNLDSLESLYKDYKLIYDERKNNLNSKQKSPVNLHNIVDHIKVYYENPTNEYREISSRTVNKANEENNYLD